MFANLTLRERRLLKQAQVGATISFILLFVPILTISLLHTSDLLAKWLGIVGVIMVLPLLYFAWQILKIAYKDQKDNPTPPLWVPKVYGIGLSINPYHRFGKLIFILLTQRKRVAPPQISGSTKKVRFKNFASEWCGAPRKNKQ